jgi:dCTP deaminase
MVLQDAELVRRLTAEDESKRIIITPLIDPAKQIGPCSIDVSLGGNFKIPMTSQIAAIDPRKSESVQRYLRSVEVRLEEPFFLHPGEFVLASTLEFIRVPSDLACRIEGRSSWGRLGLLVHATAGFVDPGYSGSLTFELFNAGKLPIELKLGMRMAQLCFFHLDGIPLRPYDKRSGSKYNNSLFAEGSRIWQDDL